MRSVLGKALRQSFERDRPVLEERQQPVGDLLVVGEDALFGYPRLGKDDALGVGQLDRPRDLVIPARAGWDGLFGSILGRRRTLRDFLAPCLGELVLQLQEQPLRLTLAA